MRWNKGYLFTGLISLAALASCGYDVEIQGRQSEPDLTPNASYEGIKKVPPLGWYEMSQGWNAEMRRAFWFTPQGSALVPYDWFLQLEMPERSCKGKAEPGLNPEGLTYFKDPKHLTGLGYIQGPVDPIWNPDGLPIGFAKTPTEEGAYLGPTCAACHSNMMDLDGHKVLVEGAPTLSDLQGLNVALSDALCSMQPDRMKSEADKAKAGAQFDRFAKRILGDDYSLVTKEALQSRVTAQSTKILKRNTWNYSAKTDMYPPYGKGRLDALGAILNEVAVAHAQVPSNAHPANAPVSYPFLWGVSQSDVVQWNGVVNNQGFGFGPLGRNVGEVIGVYGDVDVAPVKEGQAFLKKAAANMNFGGFDLISNKVRKPELGGFSSSVMMANLGSIEKWVSMLRAPQWPDLLGEIDQEKAARGRKIFMGEADWAKADSVNCVACHHYVAPEDQAKAYHTEMVRVQDIGTDPVAANNFLMEFNPKTGQPWQTGAFEGIRQTPPIGDRYGESFVFRGQALVTTVAGVIVGDIFWDGLKGAWRSRNVSQAQDPAVTDNFRYKARPLNGIWATAPYLHNGSVPNLRDLLKPDNEGLDACTKGVIERRPETFCVGSRKFDADGVGFQSIPNEDGSCIGGDYEGNVNTATLLDTKTYANSNQGHSMRRHGVCMTNEDKDALLEFLKTL